jgi:uncharacterized membrane protein
MEKVIPTGEKRRYMSDSSLGAPPALPILCFIIGTLVLLASGAAGSALAASVPTDHQPASLGVDNSGGSHPPVVADRHNETTISTNTTFTIELRTNGDARWTVTEQFNTTSESQRTAFDQLAESFVAEAVEGASLGFDAFVTASERVNLVTDRQVSIVDEQRTSSRDENIGQLTLSFTWENFARVNDDEIILDDVYETEQGLWFDGLGPGQRLVIKSPDGYGFTEFTVSESTTLEDRQLKLKGPTSFNNETLNAVLVGDSGTGDDGNSTEPTPDGEGNGLLGTVGLLLGGVGALSAVLILFVFAVGRDRVGELIEIDSKEKDEEAETSDDEPADQQQEPTPEPEPEPTEEPEDDNEIDTELLSDEERVERLLDQNGGRMKQANIVKETGWSNAKVSQLLSSMEDEDRIDKLRIGRENLISFPDEDVTEIGDE